MNPSQPALIQNRGNLGILSLKSNEKGSASAEEKSKMDAKFQNGFQRLAFMEWKLKLVAGTHGDSGETLSEAARKIQKELTDCLTNGKVDFDRIFRLYAEMIEASKTAHKEVLGTK